MIHRSLLLSTISLALAACGASPSGGTPDSADPTMDSPPGTPQRLPTWMLEDVQPESPRVGQTYGLDTFADKTVVVLLLEGF